MGDLGLPEVTLLVFIALIVFYLRTLQHFLEKCAPESRAASPGSVWLMLIPLFNAVWHFLLVIRISKSLHNELTRRGLPDTDSEWAKRVGLAMCVIGVLAGLVLGQTSFNSFGGTEAAAVTFLAAYLGCWIMYWRKIATCSQALHVDVDLSITGKVIPAKGVWWWAGFVVLESSVLLLTGEENAPGYGIALSIPIPLIMLAVCFWWYSRSKMSPRRALTHRLLGYFLFGVGTVGATIGGMAAFTTLGAPDQHMARGALVIAACLAMIAGSYFLVFERRTVSAVLSMGPSGGAAKA